MARMGPERESSDMRGESNPLQVAQHKDTQEHPRCTGTDLIRMTQRQVTGFGVSSRFMFGIQY